MDPSGCLRNHRSPNACRSRGGHKGPDPAPRFPHSADEDDDWETDPDGINDAGRLHGEPEFSMTSIISDLSRSFRDCSLRKSHTTRSAHHKEYAGHRSPLHRDQDSASLTAKDPDGRQAALCPQARSSPSLGIERSSVFNRNAAEALDTFFSEKVKAWAFDAAQQSDSYENVEDPQEPSSHRRCRSSTRKEHAGAERPRRRQNHGRPVQTRGVVVEHICSSGDNYEPGVYYDQCLRQLRHDPTSKGGTPGGSPRRQEGSTPTTVASSSARILPRCRISHVQSCEACQAFNQDLPAGKEAFYEERWGPLQEENRNGARVAHWKGGSSSQRSLSKVQTWLEQAPVDQHPRHAKPEKKTGTGLVSPRASGRGATRGSLEPKEGDPWGRAGDAAGRWSLESPAEARQGRRPHKGSSPGHQPIARILPCEDYTGPSVAACSCLFCERQKARAKSAPGKQGGKKRTDPSAQEVAIQLEAENRVSQIVAAFERRSQREAKRAERNRALQSSQHRDLEKKVRAAKGHGHSKHGHPLPSSPKSHSKEKREEEPRPQARHEGSPKHSPGKGQLVGKRPSFMDRLRGLY